MPDALKTAIGVISGTSMDNIDIALVETDGETVVRTGPGGMAPYPAALRRQLLALLEDPSRAERDPLTALEEAVTDAFAAAVEGFLRQHGLDRSRVDLVGNHGQTVFHRPETRFTRQLSDGGRMARRLGIPVVDDFRTADVKAGGQGAPLVPLYHAALASGLPQPLMVLNLGGVANVTYLDGSEIIAFDTGPASALIDDLMLKRFGLPYDAGGRIAREGKVEPVILAELMALPFFKAKPPKSLDRNEFHLRARAVDALDPHDGAATLTAFTIAATVAALDHVPGSRCAGSSRAEAGTTTASCRASPRRCRLRWTRSRAWGGTATCWRRNASAISPCGRGADCRSAFQRRLASLHR